MAYFLHRETTMIHDLQVTENSVIRTLPLEMKHEHDAIIAGSFQKNTRCISISEPGARALDLMNNGLTLAEIKKELRDTYHVAISLHGLIRGLHDANLIQSIDDRKMQRTQRYDPHTAINRIMHGAAVFFFSVPLLVCYGLLALAAGLSAIARPDIVFTTVFFDANASEVFLPALLVLSFVIPARHELFHYLAAVKSHVPASFSVGSRFVFIVFKTTVNGIDLADRRIKLRVYLAGMLSDVVTLSVFVIIKTAVMGLRLDASPVLFITDYVILYSVLNMLFQANLLFKTDLYFVFTELFRIRNLYGASDAYLASFFKKGKRSARRTAARAVKIFSALRVINYAVISVLLILAAFGLVAVIVRSLAGVSFHNISVPPVGFRDIVYLGVYAAALVVIRLFEKRKKEQLLMKDSE